MGDKGRSASEPRAPDSPLVSCLCVTENRPAFVPWLLWNYDRQSWPRRELVVVDSSEPAIELPERADVRVVRARPRTTVGAKRNLAIDTALGEIVAWFDDDDWQHPMRLAWLAEALTGNARFAGATGGWFVDLEAGRCAEYRGGARVVFNGAGFRREAAVGVRFDERVRRASDTRWLGALQKKYRDSGVRLHHRTLFFWLCHGGNLSNPVGRRRFPLDLETLRCRIGDAWGDTDDQLDALRARLACREPAERANREPAERLEPVERACPELVEGKLVEGPRPELVEGVSAMVKVTVLDAPYLAVIAPHMLEQTNYPFAERVAIVEDRSAFAGKYRQRSRGSRDELDRVLGELTASGVFDRVVEVDPDRSRVREVTERYFGADATRVPTHAATGGPIYATLFGIESLSNDLVVQFDADMLFHASGGSWVARGLDLLERDDRTWLVMTHGGPPAGPTGTRQSLGPANGRRAVWDPAFDVWRFRTASTRYFLCDRRTLHGALRYRPMRGGCAPLEQCISAAMQRNGTFRSCVAIEGSWDLHVFSHEPPFAEWAAAIVGAVEEGRVPALQKGEYDLRLDRAGPREAWRRLLFGTDSLEAAGGDRPSAGDRPVSGRQPARERSRPTDIHSAEPPRVHLKIEGSIRGDDAHPLSIVIPVRDRAGSRVRNTLASLGWQAGGPPRETIVVSLGSRQKIVDELAALSREHGAAFLALGEPGATWCKPLALNVGIRATDPESRFVMTLDADMILAPDFLGVVVRTLTEHPRSLVLCRSSDLPRGFRLPGEPRRIAEGFENLRRRASLRGKHGTGGIQAAERSFFFDVRGFDEDLVWWGAEDGDMVQRAHRAGLAVRWIDDRTAMLHQWHPKTHRGLDDPRSRSAAMHAWRRNHALAKTRASIVQRNPNGWGVVSNADRLSRGF